MNSSARMLALAGSLLSLSAVFLAALGAHLIDMNGLQHIWQTATVIHMFHGAAVLGVAALLAHRQSASLQWGAWLVVLGTVLFSGSIYLHVISGNMISGIAPIGGVLMMSGWALTALAFIRKA